jgi:hypothetical protein
MITLYNLDTGEHCWAILNIGIGSVSDFADILGEKYRIVSVSV